MEQLQLREKEIFETLKKIRKNNFVVIGGYAVNAYTLPRFSADCDIVIKDHKELKKIEKIYNFFKLNSIITRKEGYLKTMREMVRSPEEKVFSSAARGHFLLSESCKLYALKGFSATIPANLLKSSLFSVKI